mgnify:CR=1 FL=1
MQPRRRTRQRYTQSQTFVFAGKAAICLLEWLHDPRQIVGRYADPFVRNGDDYPAVFEACGIYSDDATCICKFDGVRHQIEQSLLQALFVTDYRDAPIRHVVHYMDARLPSNLADSSILSGYLPRSVLFCPGRSGLCPSALSGGRVQGTNCV